MYPIPLLATVTAKHWLVQAHAYATGSWVKGTDIPVYPDVQDIDLDDASTCSGGVPEYQIDVTVTHPAGAVGWYVHIQRQNTALAGWEDVTTEEVTASGAETYTDDGGVSGLSASEYEYRVRYREFASSGFSTPWVQSAPYDLSTSNPCVGSLTVTSAVVCTGGTTDDWRWLLEWGAPSGGDTIDIEVSANGSTGWSAVVTDSTGSSYYHSVARASTSYYRIRVNAGSWTTSGPHVMTSDYPCPPLAPTVTFNDLTGCSISFDRVVDFTISVSPNSSNIDSTTISVGGTVLHTVSSGTVTQFDPPSEYKVQGQVFDVTQVRDTLNVATQGTFSTSVTCPEPEPPGAPSVSDRSYMVAGSENSIVHLTWSNDPDVDTYPDIDVRVNVYRDIAGTYTLHETIALGNDDTSYDYEVDAPGVAHKFAIDYTRGGGAWTSTMGAQSSAITVRNLSVSAPNLSVSDQSTCTSGSASYVKRASVSGGIPSGWELVIQETNSTYSSVVETLLISSVTTSVDDTTVNSSGTNYYKADFRKSNTYAPGNYDTSAADTASHGALTNPCEAQIESLNSYQIGTDAFCAFDAGDNCESARVLIYKNGVHVGTENIDTTPNDGPYYPSGYSGGSPGDNIQFQVTGYNEDGQVGAGDIDSTSVTLT